MAASKIVEAAVEKAPVAPDHVLHFGDEGYVDHVLQAGEPGFVDHLPDDQA